MGYSNNFEFAKECMPDVKKIVGEYLLTESSFEIDTKQATDLVLLKGRSMQIACRVRKPGYAERYGYDFTIRYSVKSGAVTEITKIINGFADWMFYGHENPNKKGNISRWHIIDLASFRSHIIRKNIKVYMKVYTNVDGSKLAAFDVRKFPAHPSILIASSYEFKTFNKITPIYLHTDADAPPIIHHPSEPVRYKVFQNNSRLFEGAP